MLAYPAWIIAEKNDGREESKNDTAHDGQVPKKYQDHHSTVCAVDLVPTAMDIGGLVEHMTLLRGRKQNASNGRKPSRIGDVIPECPRLRSA